MNPTIIKVLQPRQTRLNNLDWLNRRNQCMVLNNNRDFRPYKTGILDPTILDLNKYKFELKTQQQATLEKILLQFTRKVTNSSATVKVIKLELNP